MFENRTREDLAMIAAAGGGFEINVGARSADDLAMIAAAASRTGARLIFRGVANRQADDLARIAAAGKGCVMFGDNNG